MRCNVFIVVLTFFLVPTFGRCSLLGTKIIEMNGSAMDRVFSEILWIDDSQYSLAFFTGQLCLTSIISCLYCGPQIEVVGSQIYEIFWDLIYMGSIK